MGQSYYYDVVDWGYGYHKEKDIFELLEELGFESTPGPKGKLLNPLTSLLGREKIYEIGRTQLKKDNIRIEWTNETQPYKSRSRYAAKVFVDGVCVLKSESLTVEEMEPILREIKLKNLLETLR